MASVLFKGGLNDEAASLVEKLIDVADELDDSSRLIRGFQLKASIALTRDDFEAACHACKKVLAIAERELGTEDEITLEAARNLRMVLGKNLGRRSEAIKLWRQTLSVHERVFGADHANTKYVRDRLSEDEAELEKIGQK